MPGQVIQMRPDDQDDKECTGQHDLEVLIDQYDEPVRLACGRCGQEWRVVPIFK